MIVAANTPATTSVTLLNRHGIVPSMNRKGNCWDNACSETLFASLKVERLHGRQFQTIREAKDETIAWLLWNNRTRMHSTLDYVSPMQFEQDWMEATTKERRLKVAADQSRRWK